MVNRRARNTSGRAMASRTPTGPTAARERTATEREFGLEAGDPAATHILRAAGWLRMTWDIDVRDHPDMLAKAIDKGRTAYYHEIHGMNANPRPANPVVYYIRVGRLIKIGTTVNLADRIRAYPPDALLLATEAGTYTLERKRHRAFREALAHRQEWFHPSAALIEHINSLRETPLTAADLAA